MLINNANCITFYFIFKILLFLKLSSLLTKLLRHVGTKFSNMDQSDALEFFSELCERTREESQNLICDVTSLFNLKAEVLITCEK